MTTAMTNPADALPPGIVAKYRDLKVPRYTSYPTAPHFSAAVGRESYLEWLGRLGAGDTLSLYLHVPFCRSMCWYCGCHTTIVPHDAPILDYVAALEREVDAVAGALAPGVSAAPAVTHVHFGGGTPALVPPAAFARLMDRLRGRFRFAPGAEVAVEVDPRTLTAEMAVAMGAAGVNRASLGVQSLDPAVQQAINRIQTAETTATAVERLRAAGVSRLNLDLIYGLPLQTVASATETARAVLAMEPDRLSVFGYAHVPGFKKHQARIRDEDLPGGAERQAQAAAIDGVLLEAGFERVGFDHYARPDDPLAVAAREGSLRRNFQGYTTDAATALLGFGASAIGRLPQGFVQNEVALPAWRRAVDGHGTAVARGVRFSADDRLRADIIEQVMCRFAVDLEAVARRHGRTPGSVAPDPARLAVLEADGLVARDGWRLSVPPAARALVRAVAALFDTYLSLSEERHSRAL